MLEFSYFVKYQRLLLSRFSIFFVKIVQLIELSNAVVKGGIELLNSVCIMISFIHYYIYNHQIKYYKIYCMDC
jgi:hypothetical protein